MSCQQASRLITTTVATIGTPTIHSGANANSKLTAIQEDPYVFTDTVSNTPPILFNTQKSRARANEAQHKNNSNTKQATTIATSVISTTTTVNTKAAENIVNAKAAVPLAQLNGITTTSAVKRGATGVTGATTKTIVGGVGALKAQASMVVVSKPQPTTQTTNFNNVTQSQIQLQQQAQNKRATNVCIVRPQLQQQTQQQHQQQQQQQSQHQQHQQQSAQQQQQLLKPSASLPPPPPPPLYSHTPSLWQTPLLLDTAAPGTVKLQLPISPTAAAAVSPVLQVSPPTSPASLPSPNASSHPPSPASLVTFSSSTTVTAMVAPIVLPPATAAPPLSTVVIVGGQPLPPSKFHHTTLAQHLQKVECLKKPKRNTLPLTSSNNDMINTNYEDSSPKRTVRLAQPPPLKAFDLATSTITPTTIQHKHSADDDNDLNDIPVNVIFRKPLASETPSSEQNTILAVETHKSSKSVKIIPNLKVAVASHMPPTPPTPPTPPATKQIAKFCDLDTFILSQQHPATVNQANNPSQNVPVIKSVVIAEPSSEVPLQLQKPPQQTSSIAAEVSKRKTPAAGSKTNTNKKCGKKNSLKAIVGPTDTAIDITPVVSVALTTAVTGTIAPLPNLNVGKHEINTVLSIQTPLKTCMLPKSMPQTTGEVALVSKTENTSSNMLKAVKYDNILGCITKDDDSMQSNSFDLPYYIQRNWMHARDLNISTSHGSSSNSREERIAEHKSLLRRQALQLLATRSLQKLPITLARQRLQCVDRMLHKYQNKYNEQELPAKKCLFSTCTEPCLTMASHCLQHIVNNLTQQIFTPCVAKFSSGQVCRGPVFDMLNDVALCTEHTYLRKDYDQSKHTIAHNEQYTAAQPQQKLLPIQQQQQTGGHQQRLPLVTITEVPPNMVVTGTRSNNNVIVASRKRKAVNPVGRPQKRTKKQLMASQPVASAAVVQPMTLPPISAVLQRKSSTTSLESIASNSQSSNSQAQYNGSPMLGNSNVTASFASLPALAPLSNVHNMLLPLAPKNDIDSINAVSFGNLNTMINSSFKGDDLSQIAAQFTSGVNHNNNTITSNYNNNMNFVNGKPNANYQTALNPFNGISSGSSMSVGNTLVNTNDLLAQDMFSICENSSAYASSEDTGLGGISESELIGSHEADDIPLVDTRLLEEHDLANVLSTLPVDAFNELFTSVRQDESDEMDRQLELADKHIRCLQQSIGSDSDFLGDFLDVNDDILADSAADICDKMDIVSSVMNSPETSGIDAATLFVDSNGAGSNSGIDSSGGGNGSQLTAATGTVCPSIADIRELVQA